MSAYRRWMINQPDIIETPQALLDRMFAVELAFIRSGASDRQLLAKAFHPEVVIHEPASLPYAGDWRGLDGVASLMRMMSEMWSDLRVENMTAASEGEHVHMSCRLTLVSRATGVTIEQPFAELLRFVGGRLIEGTPFYFDTAALLTALGEPR